MGNHPLPLISVLVPVYNAAPFVAACMDSILTQTYPNLEVICVDDASTDESATLLEQYTQQDKRVSLYRSPKHQGVAAARNTLLKQAGGEYIAFVDADDFIHPDYLMHLYQAAASTQADVVRCLYNVLDMRTQAIIPCEKKYREFSRVTTPVTPVQRLQTALDDSQVWLKLIKTSLLKEKQIGFIPHILPEDISFEILLYQYAGKITFINEHLYVYRVGNTHSASSNRPACAYGTLEAMVFLCGDLVRRNLVERTFYEKIIGLTLHAVRRMRKYTFPPEFPVEKTCREAFEQIEQFARYCGPIKRRKYQLMCRLAHKLSDKQLAYLACVVR